MNRIESLMSKIILSALLLVLAGFTNVASASDCRNPSQIPSSTPSSRFTENGDGTVTDKQTGLMWAKYETQPYTVTWQAALALAESSTLAGHTDWRLPNIKELSSIVEVRCQDAAVNSQIFPGMSNGHIQWSATPVASFSSSVWTVNFSSGVTATPDRDSFFHYRLVRDAQ